MNDIKYGRKTNGIRRHLRSKIEDWVASIDDAELQAAVKRDTIVTGGSLASMLMGDPVNDYDIYFRTMDTAQAVATYYVAKFNEKHGEGEGVGYTPEVRRLKRTNIRHEEEERVVIWMQSAGIAGESQSEYNYFEQMEQGEAEKFVESTLEDARTAPDYHPVFMSENAITLSGKIQLVHRFCGEPEDIHKNYDFVHATCSYDYANNELRTPEAALLSMMARDLQYTGSLYPVASVFRMKKFLARGWRITAGEQLKIMWQISELDLQEYETLREQLTGVDMAYMWELLEALKGLDKDKINSTYVAAIIDRIFG